MEYCHKYILSDIPHKEIKEVPVIVKLMVCDRLYCLVSILLLYSYQENFKFLLLINSVICDNRSQQICDAFEQRILYRCP